MMYTLCPSNIKGLQVLVNISEGSENNVTFSGLKSLAFKRGEWLPGSYYL